MTWRYEFVWRWGIDLCAFAYDKKWLEGMKFVWRWGIDLCACAYDKKWLEWGIDLYACEWLGGMNWMRYRLTSVNERSAYVQCMMLCMIGCSVTWIVSVCIYSLQKLGCISVGRGVFRCITYFIVSRLFLFMCKKNYCPYRTINVKIIYDAKPV